MTTFTGCEKCIGTGWAHQPHSDESREVCDCPAGKRVAGYLASNSESTFAHNHMLYQQARPSDIARVLGEPSQTFSGQATPYVWVNPATSEPYVWTNPSVPAPASDRRVLASYVWTDPHLGTASLAGDELELTVFRSGDFSWPIPIPIADLTWPPVLIVAAIVFGPWVIGAWLT